MTEAEKVSNIPLFADQADRFLVTPASSFPAHGVHCGDQLRSPFADLSSDPTPNPASVSALGDAVRDAFLFVGPGLGRVEQRIRAGFVSAAPQLSDIAEYLLALGGKRIRPILALLTARVAGVTEFPAPVIDAAAGIELIHMATLLHDDIIDESMKRRHQPSALAKYGFTPTLLAGDFLWVRAFGLCAHLGEFIVRSTENACVALTEGELLEGKILDGNDHSVERYLDIIGKKTASLFALSASVGAYGAGFRDDALVSAQKFGEAAGIAFQIIDDILDITADEDLLGKPSGADLRQKTPSLVNILWLRSEPETATAFFNEPVTENQVRSAVAHLRRSPALAQCRNLAEHYVANARVYLHELAQTAQQTDLSREPDAIETSHRAVSGLEAILQFTLDRAL